MTDETNKIPSAPNNTINIYNIRTLAITVAGIILSWVWLSTYFIPRNEHAILVQRDHADMVKSEDIKDFITREESAMIYLTRIESRRVTNELLLSVYQLEFNGYNDKLRRGENLGPLEKARYDELKDALALLLAKKRASLTEMLDDK